MTEVGIILDSLENVHQKGIEGDVVEFGCYAGTTSLFIARLLKEIESNKKFHVYDSFSGLPPKSLKDQSPVGIQFMQGELYATKSQFINNFKKANLELPVIHKGWFSELTAYDLPDKISFAFLDGDFYDSISDSFMLIENRLAAGSMIIVDDYMREALPGAKIAVDEWLAEHLHARLTSQAGLAIIKIQ